MMDVYCHRIDNIKQHLFLACGYISDGDAEEILEVDRLTRFFTVG